MRMATPVNDPVSDRLLEADFVAALAGLDGDRDLFREIVEILAEDSPKQLAEIRDAIGQGDALWLNRAAHTLKGALSNFQARTCAELALKLELSGGSGELAGAGECLDALEKEMASLARSLTRFVGTLGD
jgi:two-component system, sensor histidine kinase and response regulator